MQLLEHQYCRQHLALEKQKQREPLEPSSCSQDILATRGQQLTRSELSEAMDSVLRSQLSRLGTCSLLIVSPIEGLSKCTRYL